MPSNRAIYEPFARQIAVQHGIDPDIFARQIDAESGWNPNARSSAGAVGIAQIVPQYHPGVDPTDPIASLDYAAGLMRSYLDQYGRYDLALSAYQAGPGNVAKYGGVPPFAETLNYLSRVLQGVDSPALTTTPTPAPEMVYDGAGGAGSVLAILAVAWLVWEIL